MVLDIQDAQAVYGELFLSAQTAKMAIRQEIEDRRNIGFDNWNACEEWAHEHLCDIVVYVRSHGDFMYLSHEGVPMKLSAWKREYKDILFVWEDVEGKKPKCVPWTPDGFKYHSRAKLLSEQGDGTHDPVLCRNYFVPSGYFLHEKGAFNVAVPFPVMAKETGRDTSHIYTYIEHVAGECAPFLLKWLRQKCLYPNAKTGVMPVIVSRTQGNGKTTFGKVICTGLFGEQNVIVTSQHDTNARFNADVADALIVCMEEKKEEDKRIDNSSIKSDITNDTIRKENKGLDPIYQKSFTEYIITTNRDVPMKFDGVSADQRRFMIMESDESFTRYINQNGERKRNPNTLADEVFTKLYGEDSEHRKVCTPFVEDKELIAQFKHELATNDQIAGVDLYAFPITDANKRNASLPRTTETVEIDSILRVLAPFIKASLMEDKIVQQVTTENGETIALSNFLSSVSCLTYVRGRLTEPAHIALCRPLVFFDINTGRPFPHAVVERGILDCAVWLLAEYGVHILPSQLPLIGGFPGVLSRYRNAPAARFALALPKEKIAVSIERPKSMVVMEERVGERLRVNASWKPDPNGEFETVNEMKPGTTSLTNKNANVQYMDTFLLEADNVNKQLYKIEHARLMPGEMQAEKVFMERLRLQQSEADRLLNDGVAFRVVYSGSKSYHILVRVNDSPVTLDEYKWLHAYLCSGIVSAKLDFDTACNDPARLTRAPITRERVTMYEGTTIIGTQALYREMPGQVFRCNWRIPYNAWLNRPPTKYERNGKKLVPSKKEYVDAYHALLEGSFFTDPVWNGRRQHCFFPAYRLARLSGYTHEQLWSDEGILCDLNNYYRRTEVMYWLNREKSDLIQLIDKEVDESIGESHATR